MPDDGDEAVGGGSGDGGSLGTPGSDTAMAPPSSGQDEGAVVSGGGLARPSEDESGS